MSKKLFVAVLLAVACAASASAQVNPGGIHEERQHFTIFTKLGKPSYEMTEVTQTLPTGKMTQIALVRDQAGKGFVVMITTDYDQTLELVDPVSKEFLRGYRASHRDLSSMSVEVKGKKSWKHSRDEWEEEDNRDVIRKAAGPQLIAIMNSLDAKPISHPILMEFCDRVGYILNTNTRRRSHKESIVTPSNPSCAFDASFGYPCSAEQAIRSKAVTPGVVVEMY